MTRFRSLVLCTVIAAVAIAGAGCSKDSDALTVYSGRTADLVGPLFDRFEQQTGVKVKVRYGDSAEVSGAILEEGDNPRADVLLVQDAGNIGQVADAGRLVPLDPAVLDRVPEQFRSHDGLWDGVSGRARVVAYNTKDVPESELPATIDGFTDPKWKGRLAWAPTNGSFQAFVTAFRVTKGDAAARAWLEGVKANDPKVFPNNSAIVEAVGRGEVDAGFVNHYYLYRLQAEGKAGDAANKYFPEGDPGSLVNVSAVGVVKGSTHDADARRLVEFLLSDESQRYFAENTYELPVVTTVHAGPELPQIVTLARPEVDLSNLDDAKGTVDLLSNLGIL
ncbi:MAG: iron ABC transporter substrate-binding protein [Acidimicrobiales bacterium]